MAATEEAVGRSIDDATDEPNAPALMQEPIPGTGQQLSLTAGGDDPETSEVKFRGGSVPIEGQFDKGEIVNVMVKVRIAEVHFVDTIDKYGNVTGTVRRHVGKMQGVQRQ